MIMYFNSLLCLNYISIISALIGIITGYNGGSLTTIISLFISGLCHLLSLKIKVKSDPIEEEFNKRVSMFTSIICYGLLPVALGSSLGMADICYTPIYVLFIISGIIRLSYKDIKDDSKGKYFIGLPMIIMVIICPILYLFRFYSWFNYFYSIVLLVIAFLQISKIKILKPNKLVNNILIVLALIESILIIAF